MNPRASWGGVCSVGFTPYFHNSASTSSRYLNVGRSESAANGFSDRTERRREAQDPFRPLQRVDERHRLLDRPADDRLHDFRKLRGMRGREEDARLIHPCPPALSAQRADAEVSDGRMGIHQVPGTVVDALDRGAHLAVFESAPHDVATDSVAVAAIEPHEPLEVTRVADVHRVRDRVN